MGLLLCVSPHAVLLFRYHGANKCHDSYGKASSLQFPGGGGIPAMGVAGGSTWGAQEAEQEGELWAGAFHVTFAGKKG